MNYSRRLIGSYLRFIEGKTHRWRHHLQHFAHSSDIEVNSRPLRLVWSEAESIRKEWLRCCACVTFFGRYMYEYVKCFGVTDLLLKKRDIEDRHRCVYKQAYQPFFVKTPWLSLLLLDETRRKVKQVCTLWVNAVLLTSCAYWQKASTR